MKWLRCLLVGMSIAILPTARAQVPPEKAVSTFTVSDGLEINLWASEPLFVNPTCMDIDHKGRVWVCESVNYRYRLRRTKPNRPAGDRIVILEDTKGQGKADKATVFYQSPDTLAPLGIAVAKDPVGPGYKVFVCQSPDILVFEDKDGDGKADGPPKKLLTGFGGFDHDHGVHGILIGPDMKLYFSVGDTGVHGLQSSDGKGRKWSSNSTDCRAGTIWRCDLDGKNLELLAHNFRNEYEPCVDSFGTIFVSDNDDDGNQQTRICYVMPGGNYGYHPRGKGESHWHEEQPGVVPKILRTYFGSPTGMCVYEGKLLPKKYWGQLLHTDAGPRHVRCYHLRPKGAGYDVDREDMVTSTDSWFRPSDICVAPDGSVYVADWYDPGVGGHGMGDITRGRVFRIAPKGNKPSVPKVDLESEKGIVDALASPALSVRYMAMAKIREMEHGDAASLLRRAIATKDDAALRARALWQLLAITSLKDLGWFGIVDLPKVLGDKDYRVNLAAVRIMGQMYRRLNNKNVGSSFQGIAHKQRSPAVWREMLLEMRDADPNDWGPILELANKYDGKDRFYLEAIGIAVGHHDKARRDVILAHFDEEFPSWDAKTAGLIWELQPPNVLPRLEKQLGDRSLADEDRGQIVDILAASSEPNAGMVLLKSLTMDTPPELRQRILASLKLFLPNKWKKLRDSAELSAVIKGLLGNSGTRGTALALIAASEKGDAIDRIVGIARDTKEVAATRRVAIQTLGALKSKEATKALAGDLLAVQPAELRVEVVNALGRQDTPDALKALQDLVTRSKGETALKLAAVDSLAASRRGSAWLLDANDKKQLPEDLKADVGRLLRNSPFQGLRNRAMIAFPAPGKIDPKKIPSIARLLARKGDAAKGKALLAASLKNDLQCLKCHTIRGLGGNVGPDLSMIGKKASRENLFESILYPSKAIADQYFSWKIETLKGESVTGLIVEDTADHVILRDANAKDHRIARKDIDTKTKSLVSIMPENLLAFMTEDDLVDIVEYLLGLKTPALTLDYWHIAGPFDNGANDAGLDKVFPPETGIDLKATYTGKSGKVVWRTVKPDGKNYVDLRAFLSPDSNNVVSYLYRTVESPADQEAEVLLGTDDCAKLFLNGKLVHTCRQHRAAAPEQDRVKVKLKKGTNAVLLKITNGDGDHGFYLTIVAEQELKK
jgi:putative membrane-bound dehydrogenase-like protein